MIQKVKIVKADDFYSEKIANIEKNCFSDPWDINVIKESLQNENSDFFVALVMNTPVGYIGTYSVLDEVYLYNIAVEENYRNLKIGKALLQTVIDASIKKMPALYLLRSDAVIFRQSNCMKNRTSKKQA